MNAFRTRLLDNASNNVIIQGAYSANANQDIAQLIFQNYDKDTSNIYNMGSITVRDHFGDTTNNGMGDILFKTSAEGSNLYERMRVAYDGKIGVGTSNPDKLFTVAGDAKVTGILTTSNVSMCNLYVSSNIGVGTSNPKTSLEVRGGSVLAKNFASVTKTTNSLSNLDIYVNWDAPTNSDKYFIILDATAEVANGAVSGFRRQRFAIRTFNAATSSPQIQATETAVAFGNIPAYSSLGITHVYSSTSNLLIRSTTNWNTAGDLHHSFNVTLALAPDTSNVNNVWLS